MREVNLSSVLVSSEGGKMDCIGDQGEVLFSVKVPPGIVPAAEFVRLAPQGTFLQPSDGIVVMSPNAVSLERPQGVYESGANPDFKVTSASRLETTIRREVAKLQAKTDRLDARYLAWEKLAAMSPPSGASVGLLEPVAATDVSAE